MLSKVSSPYKLRDAAALAHVPGKRPGTPQWRPGIPHWRRIVNRVATREESQWLDTLAPRWQRQTLEAPGNNFRVIFAVLYEFSGDRTATPSA